MSGEGFKILLQSFNTPREPVRRMGDNLFSRVCYSRLGKMVLNEKRKDLDTEGGETLNQVDQRGIR